VGEESFPGKTREESFEFYNPKKPFPYETPVPIPPNQPMFLWYLPVPKILFFEKAALTRVTFQVAPPLFSAPPPFPGGARVAISEGYVGEGRSNSRSKVKQQEEKIVDLGAQTQRA